MIRLLTCFGMESHETLFHFILLFPIFWLFVLSLYFCHLDFFAGKQESESPPAQTAEPPAVAEPNDATETPDDQRDIRLIILLALF